MVDYRRPRDVDLLDAVDAFQRRPLDLNVWRAARRERDPLQASRSRGRWSDGGLYVLYTSEKSDGAVSEVFALLADQPVFPSRIEWSLHRLRARCTKALVVSDLTSLAALGVVQGRYKERVYDRTQEIADAAFFLGFDALFVPSARWTCQNLVLFLEHLPLEAVSLIATEDEIIDFNGWRRRVGR